jgi:7-cyano-7-deazaguanine tRNA-ribosyltransferase
MSFEVRDRDVMGRIGKLRTKSGVITTPALMPVVNPVRQAIHPRRMKKEFGCEILITNSYIIMKNFGDISDIKVHGLIDYEGVITTDSGAYQILVYGGVQTNPEEIIRFQQGIGSDIAVILDIPTGWDVPRSRVEFTVEETLKRAREAIPLIEGDKTLWIGPVQGGAHLDLVARSAREIGALPYDLHALGSPTEVMENYEFPVLTDMIMAAKSNLPPDRPFHLFGAGHPMMFSLAVALGCDLFDSAAYALYAKDERYLTTRGTRRFETLNYLPCSCPVCRKYEVSQLQGMLKGERQRLIAEHNLHVSMAEVETVRQAISEGTLWELMEARSRGHPTLASAVKQLFKHREKLSKGSPGYKGRGLFLYGETSLSRPEVTRHVKRMKTNYVKHKERLLLLKAPERKPYNKSPQFQQLARKLKEHRQYFEICFIVEPFGIVPVDLAETYPLSQYDMVDPADKKTLSFTVDAVRDFLNKQGYDKIIYHTGNSEKDKETIQGLEGSIVGLVVNSVAYPWSLNALDELIILLDRIQ